MPSNTLIITNHFASEMFFMGGYLLKHFAPVKNQIINSTCDILNICGLGKNVYDDGAHNMVTCIKQLKSFVNVTPKWLPIHEAELDERCIPQISEYIQKLFETKHYAKIFVPSTKSAPILREAFANVFKNSKPVGLKEIWEYVPGHNTLQGFEIPEHNASLYLGNLDKVPLCEQYSEYCYIPHCVYQDYEYYNLIWAKL